MYVILCKVTSKNHFQIVYKGKDISNLDLLLGAQWDIKVLEPLNPHSHFKYVTAQTTIEFFKGHPYGNLYSLFRRESEDFIEFLCKLLILPYPNY